MAVIYRTLQGQQPRCIEGHTRELVLPPVIDCNRTPVNGFVAKCGETYNEIKCSIDECYHHEVSTNDTLCFQFLIHDRFNADPSNPTGGFGDWLDFELYCEGVATGHKIDDFGQWMVAWKNGDPGFSYQNVSIPVQNIVDLGCKCFSFKIKAFNSSSEAYQEYCTQSFSIETCQDSVLVSMDCKESCSGHYYGDPDTFIGERVYYNCAVRFPIAYRGVSTTINLKLINSKSTRSEQIDRIKFTTSRLVPKYVVNELKRFLSCGSIMIDGEQFYSDESIEIVNENDSKHSYFVSFELVQKCKPVSFGDQIC